MLSIAGFGINEIDAEFKYVTVRAVGKSSRLIRNMHVPDPHAVVMHFRVTQSHRRYVGTTFKEERLRKIGMDTVMILDERKRATLPAALILVLSVTLVLQSAFVTDAHPDPAEYVVAEYGSHVLSKVASDGSRNVVYQFAPDTWPRSVAVDSDGSYVVTELLADVLSRVTPAGLRTVVYSFPRGTIPDGVAIDSGGNYVVT